MNYKKKDYLNEEFVKDVNKASKSGKGFLGRAGKLATHHGFKK